MSDGQRQNVVLDTFSKLSYLVGGAVLVTGALYVAFFGAIAVFPGLPDRLQVWTLLLLVGIPIPGLLGGACLGLFLWNRQRARTP
jgi:hypothetical protein